ncbi:MAG: VWA domain-containing protein [Planctomycetales bacterium]|nr:VWA domain-containing protein [Planctomycetales bacterium]
MWIRAIVAWLVMAAGLQAAPHVVVVLDDSGSMAERMDSSSRLTRMEAAQSALLSVANQLSDDTQLGVLALNRIGAEGGWLVPLGPLDRASLGATVRSLRAEGGTPLGHAMKLAADGLLQARAKQHYGTYRLLIVTDGEAQDSELVDGYLPLIRQRGLSVDVIGVAMQSDHSLATRVDRYRRADDAAQLEQAIRESLAETSPDDQGAATEADFELLAGLPDDAAAAILAELGEMDNQPLGESPDDAETMAQIQPTPGSGNVATPPAWPNRPRPERRGPPVTIIVITVFIMAILKSIIAAGKRRR